MKLRILNRSFGKALAASAIAFMISTASARAQQGQRGSDGCFYVTVVNHFIPAGQPGYLQQYRAGCNVRNAVGRIFYHDEIDQTWKDLSTGQLYQIAAESGSQKAGREQSTGNPQAASLSQQILRQQQTAEVFRDLEERHQRSVLNSIRTCSGEEDYWGCVQKDRDRNGPACYSSRDMNTNYCQRKAIDKAIAKQRDQDALNQRAAAEARREQQDAYARAAAMPGQQQAADARAAAMREQQQAADARAAALRAQQQAADVRAAAVRGQQQAADARAAAAREAERTRENARRK
jgi:hypothetical protein